MMPELIDLERAEIADAYKVLAQYVRRVPVIVEQEPENEQ